MKKILENIKEPDIKAMYQKWVPWNNWIEIILPHQINFDILNDPVTKVVEKIEYLLQFQNFPIPGWMKSYNYKKLGLINGDSLEVEFFCEGIPLYKMPSWPNSLKAIKRMCTAKFLVDKNSQLFKNELFIPGWHCRIDFNVDSKFFARLEVVDKWTTIFWQEFTEEQVTLEAFRKKVTTPE